MVERTNPARQIQIHKQNAIHRHPFETPPTQDRQMIDFNNKGFFKLKQNNEYAERVSALLLDGEGLWALRTPTRGKPARHRSIRR